MRLPLIEIDENTYAVNKFVGYPSDWTLSYQSYYTIFEAREGRYIHFPVSRGGYKWRDDIITLVWQGAESFDEGIKYVVGHYSTFSKDKDRVDIFDGHYYALPVNRYHRYKHSPSRGKFELVHYEPDFTQIMPLNVWVFE